VTHQANRLTESAREHMKDANCRVETAYQSPVPVAIFFESLLPFLKEFKDSIGCVGLPELLGEWILRKVYSGLVGVVSQGINDHLGAGMGSRRHDVNESYALSDVTAIK
jgi:hypothetical protein